MTIEAKLQENNELLKAILTTLQSQQTVTDATATEKNAAKAVKAAKDEPIAKNEPAQTAAPATTEQTTASTEPSATAQAGTASVEASATVEWKTVMNELVDIAKSEEPHLGKSAVRKLIDHFKPGAQKFPELEALDKNAEIMAFAKALRTPAEEDLGI